MLFLSSLDNLLQDTDISFFQEGVDGFEIEDKNMVFIKLVITFCREG